MILIQKYQYKWKNTWVQSVIIRWNNRDLVTQELQCHRNDLHPHSAGLFSRKREPLAGKVRIMVGVSPEYSALTPTQGRGPSQQILWQADGYFLFYRSIPEFKDYSGMSCCFFYSFFYRLRLYWLYTLTHKLLYLHCKDSLIPTGQTARLNW